MPDYVNQNNLHFLILQIEEPNADVLGICQLALDISTTAPSLNEMGIESIAKITEFIVGFPPIPQEVI